jgi:hypothetical protein
MTRLGPAVLFISVLFMSIPRAVIVDNLSGFG